MAIRSRYSGAHASCGTRSAASLHGRGMTGGDFELIGGFWAAAGGDSPPCGPCDMNCDGDVNAFDIEPFLDLLFGGGVPCDTCTGDVDGNGVINAFDIEPFLECLFGP